MEMGCRVQLFSVLGNSDLGYRMSENNIKPSLLIKSGKNFDNASFDRVVIAA